MNNVVPMLEIEGLSKRFGGLKAVDGLSLRLERGKILGLLGPNGSGKTTALNLMSAVLRPDSGSVRVCGRETSGLGSYQLARMGVARTFQLVRLFKTMSVRENVAAGLAFAGARLFGDQSVANVDRLIARVGLAGNADCPAGQLTYIDQKRVELARALASQPRVLLLDEWLAGLNPTELQEAIALVVSLKSEGISIVMVEHVLEAVRELCDSCIVMNAGKQIASGSPKEVLSHPDVVHAYLGDEHA